MINENQNRHIWIHSLKRLHPEIFSSLPASAETKAQNTAFDFLVAASELTSDVQTLTPTYLTLARAFVEQNEFLTTTLEKIERKQHLTPEEWGYLSYVVLIFDF